MISIGDGAVNLLVITCIPIDIPIYTCCSGKPPECVSSPHLYHGFQYMGHLINSDP